ncbi:MAG: hypothetical protein ACKVXR_04175 [Planctomycetota bacterium]
MIHFLLIAGSLLGSRGRIGEVEVVGPVRDLVISLGQSGETRLEGGLLAGERVRLRVPLPARGEGEPDVVPRVTWLAEDPADPAGSARFLGWSTQESPLDRLPPGLRSRPRPPVGPPSTSLPLAALALLPACFLLAILARERRAVSILVSLAGAALVLVLSRARDPASDSATVIELADGSDLVLEVRASFAAAEVDSADLPSTALEVDPEGAPVVWVGSLVPGAPWRARAPGSTIYLLQARDAGEEPFSLAESWIREDGEWTARGAWRTGSPLPPPRAAPAPPGWLSSGLPQGIPVLLGRLVSGARGRGEAWIRFTGFR